MSKLLNNWGPKSQNGKKKYGRKKSVDEEDEIIKEIEGMSDISSDLDSDSEKEKRKSKKKSKTSEAELCLIKDYEQQIEMGFEMPFSSSIEIDGILGWNYGKKQSKVNWLNISSIPKSNFSMDRLYKAKKNSISDTKKSESQNEITVSDNARKKVERSQIDWLKNLVTEEISRLYNPVQPSQFCNESINLCIEKYSNQPLPL
jgi:hypothetical protein